LDGGKRSGLTPEERFEEAAQWAWRRPGGIEVREEAGGQVRNGWKGSDETSIGFILIGNSQGGVGRDEASADRRVLRVCLQVLPCAFQLGRVFVEKVFSKAGVAIEPVGQHAGEFNGIPVLDGDVCVGRNRIRPV